MYCIAAACLWHACSPVYSTIALMWFFRPGVHVCDVTMMVLSVFQKVLFGSQPVLHGVVLLGLKGFGGMGCWCACVCNDACFGYQQVGRSHGSIAEDAIWYTL